MYLILLVEEDKTRRIKTQPRRSAARIGHCGFEASLHSCRTKFLRLILAYYLRGSFRLSRSSLYSCTFSRTLIGIYTIFVKLFNLLAILCWRLSPLSVNWTRQFHEFHAFILWAVLHTECTCVTVLRRACACV